MNKIKSFFQHSAWGQEMFNKGIDVGKKDAMMQAIKDVESTLPNIDELVNERISSLLGTVDERKVIKTEIIGKQEVIYFNNVMVDSATAHNFKQEAEVIVQLGLWKAMEETIRASAHKRIFTDSKDLHDITAGKMALYNLSLMKKILTVFLGK